MRDFIRAVVIFLLFWAVWIIAWKTLFVAADIALGRAPFVITVGAIIALLLGSRVLERRKQNRK